ncbi:(deoxy)nucleoside triphosphate pyrophosphohydrolase [Nocardioides ferulae]|uniref:(deoxy)nucleoside triphosphate pyrophosphohydrolase n=1 Tax=Nocardioides ferulae TaxID=2340821 RepID=UPI001F0C3464|nr:(deoxy)nucleoside triphosphate pyrophosphohydrolase [Nocardioides ferulae]
MTERTTVVGAAIVHRGRLLGARRTAPAETAGRWELPGGKVQPGETPESALLREIDEELGCGVEVRSWLPGAVPIGERHQLVVAVCRLVAGEPEPAEHDRVLWLGPDELDDVDWLEPDRPFLPALRQQLLGAVTPGVRAVFFDEDDAIAVVRLLSEQGYDAWVEREWLAGEDDDEDHPWAVLSDAPEVLLELLVDEHDGWLDGEEAAGAVGAVQLPDAPKRIKRP